MHQRTKILLKSMQMIFRDIMIFFFDFHMAIGHHFEFLKA